MTYPQKVSINGHTYTTVWEWNDIYRSKFKEYCIYRDGKKYKYKIKRENLSPLITLISQNIADMQDV
jgi:hypothetical protein